MKVDELRILEVDELGMRLRTARRELYELRFKHAMGQLENSSQISKVRHDIARIMTVLRERDFGIGPIVENQTAAVAVAEPEEPEESPEVSDDEPVRAVQEDQAPKPPKRRGRTKKGDAE